MPCHADINEPIPVINYGQKSKENDFLRMKRLLSSLPIVEAFFFNIKNAFSQYEKDLITERVVYGLENILLISAPICFERSSHLYRL